MAKPSKKDDYQKLKKIWYAKLKREGFVDIEISVNRDPVELLNRRSKANQFSETWIRSKMQYYRYADQFLNEYEFKTNLDRSIWEYHTNGISSRKISGILNKVGRKLGRWTIWNKIKQLRSEMKSRYAISSR